MFSKVFIKLKHFLIIAILMVGVVSMPTYSIWGLTSDNKFFWVKNDGYAVMGDWALIDDDHDGIGYYYYFDEKGFMLVDDITPDYRIVGFDGKRLDMEGKPEAGEVVDVSEFGEGLGEIYNEEILAQIKSENYIGNVQRGLISSGLQLIKRDETEDLGPSPADGITIDVNADGTAKTLLGKNVTLKKDKERASYNVEIERKMQDHIVGGDKYSKKVNGTIFNKNKWKEVMALKGTGAKIIFENPSNNFNRIKGRIATHYFTYSDRTTECVLHILNDENNDEIYSTADFNYNSGVSIDCTFPRKTNKLRFELEVSGQYTSRICYLRNFEYGFDREAYEEELYEDEIEEEYRKSVGTDSELEEIDEEMEGMGEIALEGEDPSARWRRLNNISDIDYEYDLLDNMDLEDEDAEYTDAMRASIAEAKRRRQEEEESLNRISGPAFDKRLIEATEAVGPDGSRRVIAGQEGSSSD